MTEPQDSRPPLSPDIDAGGAAAPFTHYLWVLRRHAWKILSFVTMAVICGYIVSKRITPIYESTVTIDIDRQMPTGVVGQDAARAMVNDSDQFLITQVKLIQSDSVIRPVMRQFPAASARGREPGASRLRVADLRVARAPSTYLLLISYRSPDPNLSAEVSNAVAKSYRDYTYETRYRASSDLSTFMEKQIEELRVKTEKSGAALARFEQDLSVINPEQKTSIISARLLQLNTDYGAAEGDRVTKEAAWRSVQSGSVEALQVSSQGAALQPLSDRLTDAEQKTVELALTKGLKHPDYVKASLQVSELKKQLESARLNVWKRIEMEYRQALTREEMLQNEFLDTKAEFDLLNRKSVQYASLKREADTDRGLYDELVRKIKEAGINAGFQNNTINISDPARPATTPIYPNTRSNLTTAFIASLFVGIAVALLSDKLDNTIRYPQQARWFLGTDVIGSLPLVRTWKGRRIPANLNGATMSTAPAEHSGRAAARSARAFDAAVCTLRNSILLSAFDHPVKSLMFTSAAPAEGKTTIAVHFAIAHAQQKHKALLIDCDMRRPGVHTKLGVMPVTGLAAALTNGASWREKLIEFENAPGLTLLPAGPSARRSADLIGSSLKGILTEAESEYDLVIVDSPPVLGFPESLQMAAAVDGVVIVAVAGETNRKAVDAVLTALRRVRSNVLGMVLNEVSASTSDGYYYDGYYGKEYNHDSAED